MLMKFVFGFFLAVSISTPLFSQDNLIDFSIPNGQEQSFRGYLTGYSFWDNTPPATAQISHPQLHEYAGGVGTYTDPITLAVGYIIEGTENLLYFPAGTRFYLPRLRKYAIVEDTCGDGDQPQDGPCHIGNDGYPWFDIYVDGAATDAETAKACTEKITAIQTFVMDPGPNYSVVVGELTRSGCFTFPDL